MVCKIQPPNPSVGAAVRYNEKKMYEEELELSEKIKEAEKKGEMEKEAIKDFENGSILATRGVPEGMSFMDAINERTEISRQQTHKGPNLQNYTFHMSVNPSAEDNPLSDDEVVSFIDDLMKELGYGNQPYRIYKHTDIERIHYHVVSTRADENGKKINDSFEGYRLYGAMRRLEEKYGYKVPDGYEKKRQKAGKKEEKTEAKTEEAPAASKPVAEKAEKSPEKEKNVRETKRVPRFNKNDAKQFRDQIKECMDDAISWEFTTFEQLQHLLLKRHNILIEKQKDRNNHDFLLMFGTDRNGKPVMQPISDKTLGTSYLSQIEEKGSKVKMSEKVAQKKRLEGIAKGAASLADSWTKFNELLERKGISLAVSFTEAGDPFGLTWTDRGTRCIWKGSETGTDLGWLNAVCKDKGWVPAKTPVQTAIEQRSRTATPDTERATRRKAAAPAAGAKSETPGKKNQPLLRARGPVHGPAGGGSTYNPDDDLTKTPRDNDEENRKHQSSGV